MIFDSSGNQVLEGVTNKEGEFSFKIPEKALTCVLYLMPAWGIGVNTSSRQVNF